MRRVLATMAGFGFTLGLLLQLPTDNSLPAIDLQSHNFLLSNSPTFRSRRSLSEVHYNSQEGNDLPFLSDVSRASGRKPVFLQPERGKDSFFWDHLKHDSPRMKLLDQIEKNKEKSHTLIEAPAQTESLVNGRKLAEQSISRSQKENNSSLPIKMADLFKNRSFQNFKGAHYHGNNDSAATTVMGVALNIKRSAGTNMKSAGTNFNNAGTNIKSEDTPRFSHERPGVGASDLSRFVDRIVWTPQLESSCPIPFDVAEAEFWKRRAEGLNVVKMEEGCGRMQNRLITFQDGSRACARYRLNTDQIQGEIFSYYLARLFNISNIPPTVLAQVDTLSPRWRYVHLQMSLAQWVDSKLVVLTQHIDGLLPANIPAEFRDEGRRLEPTLTGLASKPREELCQLLQWSDLVVFDYLTANLDRVVNNMFNRQWNDQMMTSPAHNLEQRSDGSLVFLDNESGLFHGYRLLDKYSTYHRALLRSLCIFRSSTAETIRRLHESSSVGDELQQLFVSSEALHKHLSSIPDKNVRILQQRISDVHRQIIECASIYNR